MHFALSLAGVALAYWLFDRAPDGVNAQSVGALALVGGSLIAFFRASGESLCRELAPLARELDMEASGGLGFFNDAHCTLHGQWHGRTAQIMIISMSGQDGGPTVYEARGKLFLERVSGVTIKVLPKLSLPFDRYLEHMPPELPGPWHKDYRAYGEPQEAALAVLQRAPKEDFERLHAVSGDKTGDELRLSGRTSAFVCYAEEEAPSVERLKRLLDLCEALGRGVEAA